MMAVGTSSVGAYNEYLTGIGLYGAAGGTADVYEAVNARDAFKRAIELDPEFAEAWFRLYSFWLSETTPSQVLAGLVELPAEEKMAQRRESLTNAIRLQKNRVDNVRYRGFDAWETHQSRHAIELFEQYLAERPNDETAISPYLYMLRELGRYSEATEFIRSRMPPDTLTRDMIHQFLQTVRTPEDGELMRQLANSAANRFGDDASVLYQAHRQLLYAMDIDGASRLLPRIQNSTMPVESLLYAEMRQYCAENKVDDARAVYERVRTLENRDPVEDWLPLKILGEDEEAERLLAAFDAAGDIDAMRAYLTYSSFDANPFPGLLETYAGQGLEDREVIDIPYRCIR